jgi:predicted SnoaL-like aldol condensation-catalyzing enzyme
MLRKTLGAAAAALLAITMMTTGSVAQDAATPAGECPTTTAEGNRQIVQQYVDAVVSGDVETADALLSDDYQHDLAELLDVPNEPGTADELENIELAAEANLEVVAMIAEGDWVAVDFNFDIRGEHLEFEGLDASQVGTVDVMTFIRIECGEIAEARFATNILRALLQHGFEVHPPDEGE